MTTTVRRQPMRLTRRGRAVVVALLATVAVVILVGVFARPGEASGPVRGDLPATVVRPGDTLWSIAQRYVPRGDRYAAVDEIRRLNHLDGDVIRDGQQLVLPRVR